MAKYKRGFEKRTGWRERGKKEKMVSSETKEYNNVLQNFYQAICEFLEFQLLKVTYYESQSADHNFLLKGMCWTIKLCFFR